MTDSMMKELGETIEEEKRNPPKRLRLLLFSTNAARFIFLVVAVGMLIGWQIFNPNKRVIEATAGLVLIFLLWRRSTLSAIWFLIVMHPFPFAISYGNSNFVLVGLVFIVSMLRVSARQDKFNLDRTLTVPIMLIMTGYLFSFYNLYPGTDLFRKSLVITGNFIAIVLFYYLIVNFIDDEKKLEKTFRFLALATVLVMAFTIYEMLFPGRVIIPGWLVTHHKEQLIMKDIRMGGPFHDFELLAEFFAMNALFMFLLFIRSKRLVEKTLFLVILLADVFLMLTTVTRGAFISLFIGFFYLMILSRKSLNIVKVVAILAAVVTVVVVLETFVARYTTSGSLFDRLVATTFERGVIPDNRVAAWGGAWKRGMRSPIFGHGAFYDVSQDPDASLWPHNVYLYYFNSIGIIGLAGFFMILYRLMKSSLRGINASLTESPFPEALMKILHVCLVMFIIDQIKIEYLRNDIYSYFIWIFFALIVATGNVIKRQQQKTDTAA